jgi:predicted RNA-binding Zn-ribbon protein involved in translation (DUF1610 family)
MGTAATDALCWQARGPKRSAGLDVFRELALIKFVPLRLPGSIGLIAVHSMAAFEVDGCQVVVARSQHALSYHCPHGGERDERRCRRWRRGSGNITCDTWRSTKRKRSRPTRYISGSFGDSHALEDLSGRPKSGQVWRHGAPGIIQG